ncbi:MAG: hypothetical protein WCG83_04925 [Candidatus Peregrinibacteria bacterium]
MGKIIFVGSFCLFAFLIFPLLINRKNKNSKHKPTLWSYYTQLLKAFKPKRIPLDYADPVLLRVSLTPTGVKRGRISSFISLFLIIGIYLIGREQPNWISLYTVLLISFLSLAIVNLIKYQRIRSFQTSQIRKLHIECQYRYHYIGLIIAPLFLGDIIYQVFILKEKHPTTGSLLFLSIVLLSTAGAVLIADSLAITSVSRQGNVNKQR